MSENKKTGFGIDFSVFTDPEKTTLSSVGPDNNDSSEGMMNLFEAIKKSSNLPSHGGDVDIIKDKKSKKNSDTADHESYIESYNETNNALKGVVADINADQRVITEELVKIRKSKTMGKKYDYIASLVTTKSNLHSSKIAAIKEINNNITQSHNLELKRNKDLNISNNEQDDDMQVLNLYKSFINTPKNTVPDFITDSTIIGSSNVNAIPTGVYNPPATLTPQQNMMLLEHDPNIKTVVKYNQVTGDKWFDVINIINGQSIPNSDIPGNIMLENIKLDTMNMVAKDTNLDLTYPLVFV